MATAVQIKLLRVLQERSVERIGSELPPLHERREGIPLLFEHFTLLAATRYKRPAPELSNAQLSDVMAYA